MFLHFNFESLSKYSNADFIISTPSTNKPVLIFSAHETNAGVKINSLEMHNTMYAKM